MDMEQEPTSPAAVGGLADRRTEQQQRNRFYREALREMTYGQSPAEEAKQGLNDLLACMSGSVVFGATQTDQWGFTAARGLNWTPVLDERSIDEQQSDDAYMAMEDAVADVERNDLFTRTGRITHNKSLYVSMPNLLLAQAFHAFLSGDLVDALAKRAEYIESLPVAP